MWWFKKRVPGDGFPSGFKIQRIGIDAAKGLENRPPLEIARYFRDHPNTAKNLMSESYDKRYSPSSFIAEEGGEFRVGWYSKDNEYECVARFSNLADAATDYLLFSRGKGRWRPPEANNLFKAPSGTAPV
jgi:hypothetical protein